MGLIYIYIYIYIYMDSISIMLINNGSKIFQSNSGGCCDCGDPQAWKPSGFCRKHQEGYARRNEDGVALLPDTIRRNATEAIFFVVSRLCYSFLKFRNLEVSVL